MRQNKLPNYSSALSTNKMTANSTLGNYITDLNKTINKFLIGESEMTSFDLKTIDNYEKAKKENYRSELLQQIEEKKKKQEQMKKLKQQESLEFELKLQRDRELLRQRYAQEEQLDQQTLYGATAESNQKKMDILDSVDISTLQNKNIRPMVDAISQFTPNPQGESLRKDQGTTTEGDNAYSIFNKSAKVGLTNLPQPDHYVTGSARRYFSSSQSRPNNQQMRQPAYAISQFQVTNDVMQQLNCNDLIDAIQKQLSNTREYKLITF
jgi:hypothetical protein